MSLKDTIRGAREEAAATGNPFDRGTEADDAATQDEAAQASARYGRARSSAASAKPSRAAAAGVRVVSANGTAKSKAADAKSKANMTKDEKKAARKAEREREDVRYTASQIFLEENDEYMRVRTVWRRLLIVGVVFMASALLTYVVVTNMGANAPEWMMIGSLLFMVVSYLLLIAAMIYDYRKIKPLRDAADQRVSSMSDKKVRALVKRRG